jgi:hypothetical protein
MVFMLVLFLALWFSLMGVVKRICALQKPSSERVSSSRMKSRNQSHHAVDVFVRAIPPSPDEAASQSRRI